MFLANGSLLATPPSLDRVPVSPVPRRHQYYEALRLPIHASPVTYLFRFRGPRDSSSVRARRCQRSRAGGGPATGQDHCKLPAYLHVDASGTSQVPRRPILCLCPVPRPRPNRRSLANNGRIRCCPCCRESKGSSVLIISRLQRGFGTCCLRFKSGVATATCKTRFRLTGWPLPGGS